MLSSTKTTQDGSAEAEYECALCKDHEGTFYRDDKGLEYWRDCECVKRKRIAKLMDSCEITPEFRSKTLECFETQGAADVVKAAHACCDNYANDFDQIRRDRKNSIALMGRPGSGKTHLLMGVSNKLIEKGIEVVYFPWVEGFDELKSDFSKLNQRITRMQKADVLFIDDMFKGRETPTEFQIEQLFAILNPRYLQHLPILISSERSIAEMVGYDEAVGSRINEMCRNYKVNLKGGTELNYRLR